MLRFSENHRNPIGNRKFCQFPAFHKIFLQKSCPFFFGEYGFFLRRQSRLHLRQCHHICMKCAVFLRKSDFWKFLFDFRCRHIRGLKLHHTVTAVHTKIIDSISYQNKRQYHHQTNTNLLHTASSFQRNRPPTQENHACFPVRFT